MKLTNSPKLKLSQLMSAPNVCALLPDTVIDQIGAKALEGFRVDLASRRDWERRQADANKLALQVVEQKQFPWPHAANVKFPLVTVAAFQYQARAYATLIPGTDLVKCQVFAHDPDGKLQEQADRISAHMSWQNLHQDPAWEEDHDKLLLVQAIAGCGFVKRVFEPGPGRQVSMLVLPKHFVISYYTRSIDDSPRYTHTYYLNANNIRQREMDGRYREFRDDDQEMQEGRPYAPADTSQARDALSAATDQRQGIQEQQPEDITPWFTGEQYCWIDLDNDGYEEPYIVTFDIGSGRVRRIVARFLESGVRLREGRVYKITPVRVFQKYPFIPSPDGGFYDLGLGSILGPLNASVNTIVNQCLDAGTMATLGGGFLGRGFKGRSGPITFAPHQWHSVDAPGDDIRKNVLPLPIREPSDVLLKLLDVLIQYGQRIVSATDIQVGENPGQNTPAETSRMMNENGQRVYSAIYKRTWRALRDEFRIQFELNRLFLQDDEQFLRLTARAQGMVKRDDYLVDMATIVPTADPHVVSDAQAEKQAGTLVQLSASHPNFNRYKSMVRLLKALRIPAIDEIYPPPRDPKSGQPLPDVQPPPNFKMLDSQAKLMTAQSKMQKIKMDAGNKKVELQLKAQELGAKILDLQADAMLKMSQAKSEQVAPLLEMIKAEIEATAKQREHILGLINIATDMMQAAGKGDDEDAQPTGDQPAAGQQGGAQGLAEPAADAGVAPLPAPNGAGGDGGMGGAEAGVH